MYYHNYEKFENFNKDLSIAQKYERWIGYKFDTGATYNKNNEYDIKLSNGITIEVKHDYQTKTGNIAIEFFCRDKPSAISTTKADYWVFIFPLLNEVWKIKTSKLKEIIKDFKLGLYEENWTSELYYRDNVPGGDDMLSKLHLIRRSDVIHLFNVKKMNIPRYE